MNPPLRWGVLGVSELVGRKAVLPALQRSLTAELVAIGSRDPERARAEAARFGAPRWYNDYGAVLADPEVEAVYLPLPNSLHLPWALAAARAGKHVLCEKPLACNAAEAREIAAACQAGGVVLMEAYMTPFHPRSEAVLQIARSGRLGALRFAHTAFTFTASSPPPPPGFTAENAEIRSTILSAPSAPSAVKTVNYRWLPEMGGGALLDVGIYCLTPLIAMAGREPVRVAAQSVTGPSGIDVSFSGWLGFGDGFTASFEASFEAPELQLLEVVGTEAHLVVERAFTAGPADTAINLAYRDGREETVTSAGNDPYQAMVEHFAAVVRGDATLLRTPADSIAMLELLDRLTGAGAS